MDIKVKVINQRLKILTNLKTLVAGSQKFVRFVFDLPDEWDGLMVFAQFRQGDVAYNDYLDSDNSVYLPPEIQKGECILTLYGTGGNTIAITGGLKLNIEGDYMLRDAQSTEISLSLYQQLVNLILSGEGGGGGGGGEIVMLDVATPNEIKSYLNI